MPRPICVDCQVEMEPVKNAFIVELMAADKPYQKFSSDKWACPNCQFEVVVGFGQKPVAEHYQKDRYASYLTDLKFWGSIKDKQKAEGRE